MSQRSNPLFSFGRTVATPAALQLLEDERISPGILLERHVTGDWGDLCKSDKAVNVVAIVDGGRVFSVYEIGSERIYVITEADRSHTTILLASEY